MFNCQTNHAPKENESKLDTNLPTYHPKIYQVYLHDQDAFTQGLFYFNGFLYESTGLYGHSTLCRVELESGLVIQKKELDAQYFGEGITLYNNKIIQLTWQSQKGFVYDLDSFNVIKEFSYPTEGWGITFDGQYLVMSDGTDVLYYLDPESYQIIGHLNITENGKPLTRMNELEYINGNIYANIWEEDQIAIINAGGKVVGWIDLEGILLATDCPRTIGVLNGIAYNAEEERIYITGKNWCKCFAIELVP
jgi:glutamine cyclotransferase